MKIKFYLTLFLSLFICSQAIFSQQLNYPVKTIDGKEYYQYTVQVSEGLYSISKRFGVTQAEINRINPEIHDGLKAGQVILIPKKETASNVSVSSQEVGIEYVLHTVERRQTLFAISRKYNVTQDVIVQSNPILKERGIQPGDVLRIPVRKEPEQKTEKKRLFERKKETEPTRTSERTLHIGAEGNFIKHKVAQKETLFSLSRQYNVTVAEIEAANPDMTDGLKAGTVINIPLKSGMKQTTIEAQIPKAIERPKTVKTTYKVAYLLPFMLNNGNKDATIDKFLDFYLGSLLAINNAKNGSMNFEIHTFDIEKTETKVHEVINKPELQEMDLIIGPAYTAQIPVLTDFAKRHKIHTVIPFSSKVSYIDSNPYIFQFNPDHETQVDFLANKLKTQFASNNIIFVETGDVRKSEDDIDIFNILTRQLNRQNISFKKIKGSDMSQVENYLSASATNIFIFDSERFNQVQIHLSDLHTLSSKYNIGVIGQYSWRAVSGKKPKMYYVSPFNGHMTATQFYESEFKKYYGDMRPITNPRFDLLGYDLTTFFLSTMLKDGFSFIKSDSPIRFTNGVQSNFYFQRVGNKGGFINQNLYLIEDEAKSN